MECVNELMSVQYSIGHDGKPVLCMMSTNSNIVSSRVLEGDEATSLYKTLKGTDAGSLGRSPKSISIIFKDYFPMFKNFTWCPHAENSIKIYMEIPIIIDDGQYIFTYKNEKEWSLETFKIYKNNLSMERSK